MTRFPLEEEVGGLEESSPCEKFMPIGPPENVELSGSDLFSESVKLLRLVLIRSPNCSEMFRMLLVVQL